MLYRNDAFFIAAAGGSSSRFGSKNKLLELLDGKPVFLHCLLTAAKVIPADHILLVVPAGLAGLFHQLCSQEQNLNGIRIVHGGASRTESVLHGIQALQDESSDMLTAIHDAGRPFLTEELLTRSYDTAKTNGGAVVCRKICDTVKSADAEGRISHTIPRDPLWAAETPQTFRLGILRSAYEKAMAAGGIYTDDSQIVELFSDIHPVIVENRNFNLKITYSQDLTACRERLLRKSNPES